MAFSYQNYTGDNTTDTFAIPFDYTAQSEISVTVDGVAETGLTFPSAASVQLTSAPATGTLVQVRRTTDLTAREVDFASGSVLTEEDLDNSNIQVFHAAQEAVDKANDGITLGSDDKWDAQSKVIKNVADPVNNTDAVNKQFISTNLPNINTVAGIAQDVTDVANIASNVTAVANDATDIGTVAARDADIGTVAGQISPTNNIATVAARDANIGTVAARDTDIGTVAARDADIATVAGEISPTNNIATVVANITDIQNAEEHAQESKDYAIKVNGEVQELGVNTGNYSSKAWATGGSGVTSTAGAGAAKEWATTPSNTTVDGTELSAKAYAVGDMNRGSAGSHSAKDWASYVSGLNTVDGTYKSARAYAIDAANAVADFNQVYYGTYANDTDAETAHTTAGNTVAAGDLYFSTTTNAVRYYDGTSWTDIAAVNTSNFATAGFSIAMSIAL